MTHTTSSPMTHPYDSHDQLEPTVAVKVDHGGAGAVAHGLERVADVPPRPLPADRGLLEQPVRARDVVDEDLLPAVVVKVGGDDGADAGPDPEVVGGGVGEGLA